MSDETTNGERDRDAAADALARGMGDVIAAALGVGASMARVAAETTAGSRGVERPATARPLEVLVHYGMATVTNVLGIVAAGAGLGVRGATAAAGAAADVAHAASGTSRASGAAAGNDALPTVRAGHTLRVPLSVENPGASPMTVTPVCETMKADGSAGGDGMPLAGSAVRFEPATLDIAARDFEKLTVFVDAPPDAAPGRYTAAIELGAGVVTSLRFEVAGAG